MFSNTAAAARLAAFTLPAAGLLMLAGGIVDPHVDETTSATYYAGLGDAAAQDRYQVSAFLLHLGFLLMVPAVVALAALTRATAWRTAAVVLGGAGFATLNGLVVTDYYDIALASALPADQAAAVGDAAQALTGATLLTLPASLGATIGLTIALVGAWRARTVPLWSVIIVPAAMVAPYTVGDSIGAFVVMAIVLCAAFALIARRLIAPPAVAAA